MPFLGFYTAAELQDLLTQKDQEIMALGTAFAQFDASWRTWDPAADAQWMVEYNALKARYAAARLNATKKIALAATYAEGGWLTPGIPLNQAGADEEYKATLRALQKQSGATSPGDFQDLWQRLQTAITSHAIATNVKPTQIQEPVTWQPGRGTDADENAIKTATAVLQNPILNPLGIGIPSGPTKKTSTEKLLAIGGALTLGAIAAVKVGWKFVKPF